MPFLLTILILIASALPAQAQKLKHFSCKEQNCQDPSFNVSFTLPPKWKIESQRAWSDAGDRATTVSLQDPASSTLVGLYYRLLTGEQPSSVEGISQQLQIEVEKKVALRTAQGLVDYRMTPDNCEERKIGNRQAMSCIAVYPKGGRIAAEYLTWIRTGRCLAQFWVMTEPKHIDALRIRMESLIQSLEIP